MPELPLSKLIVLLFVMTGPLRVIPAFASLTASFSPASRHRLARRGVVVAALGVLLAVVVGHPVLEAWDTTPQALAAATGLLLLLAALQPLVGWPAAAPPRPSPSEPELDIGQFALTPLAFPTILPPYAVGVLVLFAGFFPDLASLGKMLAAAYSLLLINLVAMIYARQILKVIRASTLQLLGAVFGVLQLALAIQMIFWALRTAWSQAAA
ncbi:MAG: MarC family protein [Cyanobacteriota bacterium]|nr:MarC family protein [Cyanobacteriota bacterium]